MSGTTEHSRPGAPITPPRRVVKLGGSLLKQAGLSRRLDAWFATQPRAATLVVVGGGEWVEALRRFDRRHGLDAVAAHWLSIRAMEVTARVVAEAWPACGWLDRLADWQTFADSKSAMVVDPWQFVAEVEPHQPGTPLPYGWHVTSDSIAARLAEVMSALELVLLKSALPGEKATAETAAAAGYVDPWFPHAAARVPRVRCVDLTAEPFAERELRVADVATRGV